MYCGDEVYSVVSDLGTQSSRFGYAGEDSPKAVFPSAVGHVVGGGGTKKKAASSSSTPAAMDVEDGEGDNQGPPKRAPSDELGDANIGFRRTDLDLKYPLENGHVKDWDAVERIWAHGFQQLTVPDGAKGTPFLYALPTWTTPEESVKVLELAFERFEMGAVYLARSAMLSAFSTGRASGVVCDCGAGSTSAVPVLDGYVLSKLVGKSERGGNWLDGKVGEWLASKKVTVRPFGGQEDVMGKMQPSYRRFQEQRVVRDVKESVCMVPQLDSEDGAMFDVEENDPEEGSYELPDGTKLKVDKALRKLPELLFVPAGGGSGGNSSASTPQDLPGLVYSAIEKADVDVRKELLGNVMLTGAGSLFRGASERLQTELTEKVPVAYKVKVVTATPLERRSSAWIGGSVLASLGSFQQLWLSKPEYEEMGADRACRERFH